MGAAERGVRAPILYRRSSYTSEQRRARNSFLIECWLVLHSCSVRAEEQSFARVGRRSGWSQLLAAESIDAGHMDKSFTKRHARVFTKLQVLELLDRKVLLLDLDLLPRSDANMAELFAVGRR